MSDNDIEGRLSSELVVLSNLEYLDLSDNRLLGLIPDRIGDLTNLVELRIANSGSLGGELPTSLGQLSSLEVLEMPGNSLNLLLPTELGLLSNLRKF